MAFSFAIGVPAVVRAQQGAPAARTADSTEFRGRVVRENDTAAVVGADVWLVSLDRHATTDSTGTYHFTGLPAGTQLVQVRAFGFLVKRDVATLTAGRITRRDYALMAQAAQLDTVRTTAGKEKYLSPLLRGFEERRLSGEGGYFISDSVLRQNESSTLANLVSSRIPGLQALYSDKQRVRRAFVSTRKQCRGLALVPTNGSTCQSSGQPDCYVAIYLDGVLYFNAKMAGNGAQPPDVEREFNLADLAGIEYYAGAASAPAGMNADDDGCGSLWLWTRER